MSEWWSYGLRDLLMFSPQTYSRLFELYNAAVWPVQLLALALGVLPLLTLIRPSDRTVRGTLGLLVLFWLAVAWGFFWQRYAQINLAAPYFAGLFVLEAVLLVGAAAMAGRASTVPASRLRFGSALALYLVALCVYPLRGAIVGGDWSQAEVIGLAPDPTALATLAVLLGWGGGRFWMLAVIPGLWCLFSGATLWALDAPDFFVAPMLAVLTGLIAAIDGSAHNRGQRGK